MRTTVTLDPDTEQIVRRRMRERGMSFKAIEHRCGLVSFDNDFGRFPGVDWSEPNPRA